MNMEMENTQKSNAKVIILIVIGLLIALLAALGIYYKLRMGDPVTLTTSAIEELGESLSDENSMLGKFSKVMDDNDTYELGLTGKVTLPMDMGDVDLDMKIQDAKEDKEAVLKLDMAMAGEEALYLEGKLDKNATYVAFKENASKFYYLTDVKYPEELEEIELDKYIDLLVESFEETVKKDDFTENEKEITVNDEKIQAKQYNLKITEELASKYMDTLLKKVKNDEDVIEEIASLSEMSKEDVKAEIDTLIEDLDVENAEFDSEYYINYNIYVYKNKAVRYEITDEEITMSIDNYKNYEVLFTVVDDYDGDTTLSVKEVDSKWVIDLNSADLTVDGTIEEDKYDLTVNAEGVVLTIAGTEEFKEVSKGKEVTLKEKGNITMEQDGTTISIPYDFNVTLKAIDKIDNIDTSNKVDINNMTEAEQNELYQELSQVPLLSSLMSGYGTDYDTEYDYDYDYDYDYSYDDTYSDDYSYTEDYDYGYGYGY